MSRAQRRAFVAGMRRFAAQCGDPHFRSGMCAYVAFAGTTEANPMARALDRAIDRAIRNPDSEQPEGLRPYISLWLPQALVGQNITQEQKDRIRRRWLSHWVDTGEALNSKTYSQPIRTRKRAAALATENTGATHDAA